MMNFKRPNSGSMIKSEFFLDEPGLGREEILQKMSPASNRLQADEWGRWRKRCGLDWSSRMNVSHCGIYTDFS